jgi:polysaccharide biosynthesis protein PelF
VTPKPADVCLVLEGTYPYVAGGVSSWVHVLLRAFQERRFALWHIGPHPDAYGEPRYQTPDNVVALEEVYCADRNPITARRASLLPRRRRIGPSRVLEAIRRIHLHGAADAGTVSDLAAGDLGVEDFLFGDETFDLFRELYDELTPDAPFTEVFWHLRAMHVPLLRLLAAPVPEAGVYHAVSTGYAGLLGLVAAERTGRPLLITEHGLYAREREMELSRAPWIDDEGAGDGLGDVELSPLRGLWSRFFRTLSRLAYQRANRLLTLSEVNRRKQVEDGAAAGKLEVIPNGVELATYAGAAAALESREPNPVMRVGFVGRVVPIKDVIMLIRAVSVAVQSVDLEVWIIGPQDEDPAYARRCTDLVAALGLEQVVRFLGPQPVVEYYPQLDVLLLTSISEGQPLVILEAHAAGLPVVATDVGSCRELLEGRPGADVDLGPSGIVTRVADPESTAGALVALARNPARRRELGRTGLRRVTRCYQLGDVVAAYDGVYQEATAWPA